MCILQTRTYWKVGTHGTEIKFLKSKTEMYQQIELKEYMRKMGYSSIYVSSLRVMVIKTSKIAGYFPLDTAKNQFQFGKYI